MSRLKPPSTFPSFVKTPPAHEMKKVLELRYADLRNIIHGAIDEDDCDEELRSRLIKVVSSLSDSMEEFSRRINSLPDREQGALFYFVGNLMSEAFLAGEALSLTRGDANKRVHRAKGSRLRAAKTTPEREDAIEHAISTADPREKKLAASLADRLTKAGHKIGADAMAERLRKAGVLKTRKKVQERAS